MTDLEQFRQDKDNLFATQPESPLTDAQKKTFKGLHYFAPNPDFVFRGLEVQKSEGEETIAIPTSAGDTEPHRKVGKFEFILAGKSYSLTVFENIAGGQLFLPFKDATNGSETYHDGRYLEIEIEDGKIVELDFNYAYNPYCAYNDKWRCPKTPEENTLSLRVEAGEKNFH